MVFIMHDQDIVFDSDLNHLLSAICQKYKYDFQDYLRKPLKRRMVLAMNQLHCEDLSELLKKTMDDPLFFEQLLQYLTIAVTEMFRDPPYFLNVRKHILPVLKTYPSIKIWVAGCSTGEEAYSLAILLKEEGLLDRAHIYGTDINARNLKKAELGQIKIADLDRATENYFQAGGKAKFSDYYTIESGIASYTPNLRARITFTDHSLSTDSVFLETQFVSCRNVLIYFDRKLQGRTLELFYESLCRKGFLGLGLKETLDFTKYASTFNSLGPCHKLYQKNDNNKTLEKTL